MGEISTPGYRGSGTGPAIHALETMPHADPEKRREYQRAYNARTAEKKREYHRLRYWRDPEKAKQSGREYWAANPEKRAERNALRRKRLKEQRAKYGQLAKLGLSPNECEEMLATRVACSLCGDIPKEFHLDHIIPRSRGGSNNPKNLQWLCVTCNMAKGALTPDEFIAHIKKILARVQ